MIGNWTHFPRYGVEESYKLGMDWLNPCYEVEDWGCGPAYSKQYRRGVYTGVDGTPGFCDRVADLREYRSDVDGIFMRHVLEHNHDWQKILDNAIASFRERMSLIFFSPWVEQTHVDNENDGIIVLAFNKEDILKTIRPYLKGEIIVKRKDKPMYDTVFRLQK
jgi:hypothetical protein